MKRVISLLMAACALLALCWADLHDPNNAADYMIVTTQELINQYPWINQLAQLRNDHGRTAMVVATDSVWAEFGTGVPSDTVLKTFLHYARDNWQAPQLKDVFIVGFHDVVPSHVEVDSLFGTFTYLSDYFYVTDPESEDYLPLLSIGRLPWTPRDGDALWNYYAKVTAYELADHDAWQTRVQLIADSSDAQFNFVVSFAEPIAQQVQPGYTIERDYLEYPEGDPWHGDREEILANLDSGAFFAAYLGHGDGDVWSASLMLDSASCDSLTNGVRMPLVCGMTFDILDSTLVLGGIPKALIRNPEGGAIGYFGWTSTAWAQSSTNYKRGLMRLATSDSVQTLGDIWQQAGSWYRRANPGPFYPSIAGFTIRSVMLFGDPGLILPPRPTAADDVVKKLPQEIRLLGNYPNPFNASTVIKFELDRAVPVSLKVYDVLGREAATLVDGMQATGSHAVTWDARAVSSGVYFAVLQVGEVRQTVKMMMLK